VVGSFDGRNIFTGNQECWLNLSCSAVPAAVPTDALEAALKARAALAPQLPAARAAIGATTTNVRRLRGVLFAAGLAVDLGRAFRSRVTQAALQQLVAQQQLQRGQQGDFKGGGLSEAASTKTG